MSAERPREIDLTRIEPTLDELAQRYAGDPCDGVNPMTRRACIRQYHHGYHEDAVGAQWVDEE